MQNKHKIWKQEKGLARGLDPKNDTAKSFLMFLFASYIMDLVLKEMSMKAQKPPRKACFF